MAITYRGNGAWGTGKGSNLTAAEVDGNFWDHEGRIGTLETTPAAAVEISSITQAGDTITIHMDNGDTYGPFNLPYAPQRPTVTTAVTAATLTPTAAQSNYYFRCSNAGECVVRIMDDVEGAYLDDTEYHFRQTNTGQISFDTDTGVMINVRNGYIAVSAGLHSTMTLKKVGTDEWDLIGDSEAAT